jgi:Flp pilus assembly pilin Flp
MSKFLKDRRSVTALEYALLGAAMGLVLVTVLRLPVENLAGAVSRFVAAMHAPPSGP